MAALVRASQALDALYGPRYPGTIAAADQDLLWPRIGVTWRGQNLASDVVPAPKTKAAYELALRELMRPGSLAPDIAAGPQKVLTGVKGITWQVVNDGLDRRAASIPAVEALLADLVTPKESLRGVLTEELVKGENPTRTALNIVGRISRATGKRENGLIGLSGPHVAAVEKARSALLSGDPAAMREYLGLGRRSKQHDRLVLKAIQEGKPTARHRGIAHR